MALDVAGRINAVMKNAALWAGLGTAFLVVALSGLGFLIAGFFIWLTQRFDHAAAAAITGGVLLLLSVLLVATGGAIIRRTRKQRPSLLSEFGGTFGLGARLLTMIVRRDPKKAIIVSAVVGALAEFIMAERKK